MAILTKKVKPAIFTSCDFLHGPKYSLFADYETVFPLRKIKFCGYEFYGLNDVDTHLTANYGDYMAYPKYIDNIHTDFAQMPIEHIYILKSRAVIRLLFRDRQWNIRLSEWF